MNRSGNATRLGAILVAVGASACCWLPLFLVGLGAGATGAGAVFESLRPYLMVATVALLGAAFYYTYRRKTVCADDGTSTMTGPSRRAKVMLWAITAVAVVSFAFPYWSAARLSAANAGAASLGSAAFEFQVDGMTCAACAVAVHEATISVPGVVAAKVEESPGRVQVWTEGEVDPDAVVSAIRKAGYRPGVPIQSGSKAPSLETAYIEVKGMVQQLGIT